MVEGTRRKQEEAGQAQRETERIMKPKCAAMSAPRVWLVFSGTYQQAKWWARGKSLGPREWTYLSDHSKLCGVMPPEYQVVRYGTWYERKDADDMEKEIEIFESRITHNG